MRVRLVVISVVVLLLVLGTAMVLRADSRTNKVAMSSSAKPVTVVKAKASTFRPTRSYVGTLEAWVTANIGPQLVAAYVDTVLVRPGASVKKGEVLATLDCRNVSASSKAVAMQARSIEARQQALASEAARTEGLLKGGFVSPNEVEQKSAMSSSEAAQLESTKAKLVSTALEVSDCILRAPFDGEVGSRSIDPGAFVRPGAEIVSLVDRRIVRLSVDAPEIDFDIIAPGTPLKVHLLATGKDLSATISRRAPSADPGTRTVHFEVDIADPKRQIPVGTTGEARIEVGKPEPATEVPLYAASIKGAKATVFVSDGPQGSAVAHARTLPVLGEAGGSLFVTPELSPESYVVTQGQVLLQEGDRVTAKELKR